MDNEMIIYVKALTNGIWFGAWAPMRAHLEWLRDDEQVGLFTLTEPDLGEEDEYEFYQPGALLIGVLAGEHYQVQAGVRGM